MECLVEVVSVALLVCEEKPRVYVGIQLEGRRLVRVENQDAEDVEGPGHILVGLGRLQKWEEVLSRN